MKIKINSFCSMSRNPDWLEWLKQTDQTLFYELNDFLRTQKGCKSAKEKMLTIYRKLYEKGNGQKFEDLVQTRFPYIIQDKTSKPKRTPSPVKNVFTRQPIRAPLRKTDQSLNKHKVFKSYRPDMLTFPQKLIIVDANPKSLADKVRKFTLDKVSSDFVILGDRAYVEYFLPKYKNEALKIPQHSRDIAQFRMKMTQRNK